MEQISFFYITCESQLEAENISQILLSEEIAACANIFQESTSMYLWKGEIRKDKEVVLILKSASSNAQRLIQRVQDLHSYEFACIVEIPIKSGQEEFINWVCQNTL